MVEIYDIETLSNCFTYTGMNRDTKNIVQFVIHKDRNDYIKLIEHLKTLKGQIGYNNINFDYPIIHHMLRCEESWSCLNGEQIADMIYLKAQEIINVQDEEKWVHVINEWQMIIPQLDLYRINHFDNKAKRTSLKALEFWMQSENLLDMPVHHSHHIKSSDFQMILDYNLNDVLATFRFYELCKSRIELRKDLSKQYGLRLMNANDTKIGSDIILDLLSKELGIEKKDLRKLRTFRPRIALVDVILPQISFETKLFNDLLKSFKSTVITSTKGSIENSVIFKGFKYDYGTGGLHGCIKPDVYESDDVYVIRDADVASLYPSIAIMNKFYPEHLTSAFSKVYGGILKTRIKAKREGNKTVNEGLKLALNGAYGKSSDMNSYLYDPKFTMAITINGQLLLTQLCEMLVTNIEDLTILQVNTDGVTVRIKRGDIKKYESICKIWEEMTKLSLEFVDYSKMIIQDVNNYMAIKVDGKIKYKGLFEIEKEFHKDTSFKIVQIALSDYFSKGISIEETIYNHKNIFDYCGRAKFIKDSYGEIRTIKEVSKGYFEELCQRQQKTTRFLITTKGATFIKVYPEKDKEFFINKGFQVTIFNKFVEKPIKDYDLNYNFYILECKKILQSIEDKQLNLF